MRDIPIDYQSPTSYFSPASQDQGRGLPFLLASLHSTMDDSNLSSAILSRITRYTRTSRCWSVLLQQHKDTSQPQLTPYTGLLGTFTNYECAASRFCSRLKCYWLPLELLTDLTRKLFGSQAMIKDVVDWCHSDMMCIP